MDNNNQFNNDEFNKLPIEQPIDEETVENQELGNNEDTKLVVDEENIENEVIKDLVNEENTTTGELLIDDNIEEVNTGKEGIINLANENIHNIKAKPLSRGNKKNHPRPRKMGGFSKFLIFVDVCAVICFFIVYGPLGFFRNWFVSTALTTMTHQYFAYTLYTEDMIKDIASQNVVIESGENTDTNAIKITDVKDEGVYESIYEEQILKRDPNNDLFKLVEIEGDGYKGFMVVIYDPSRIDLVMAKKLNNGGQMITDLAESYESKVAINASGFMQLGGGGVRPRGNVIKDGQVVYDDGTAGQFIGFTKDNILSLATMSASQAVEFGYKNAVEFGPFLIVNGEPSIFKGDGGYGIHPRTAIGQRQDGIVLMVIIDGRQFGYSNGINMPDLADIFIKYKAYNAANLDGGGSTSLAIGNKLINKPAGYNYEGERYLADAWIVR
ncbi:MAG: phosphodiester glycosidase family protein [Erysipelotrichaceae bacterium]